MTYASGLANLALGVIYIGIGTMVAMDLEKQIRRRGYSHFGVAWLTIMYTCGLHHLIHGLHLGAEGRVVGGLDLMTVAMGLPAGTIWSLLRIEAVRGGRGDRFIAGTPPWLRVVTAGFLMVAAATLARAVPLLMGGVDSNPRYLPNVLLVLLYLGIGAFLLRGQFRNRSTLGGWSMSGLSLMMIFPTCALMHAMYVVYASTGTFVPDYHGLWIGWISVPAAMYFFWIVSGLEMGTVKDWNERFEAIEDLSTVLDVPMADSVEAAD